MRWSRNEREVQQLGRRRWERLELSSVVTLGVAYTRDEGVVGRE